MTTKTATQRHELEKRIPTPAPPYEPGKLAAFANVMPGEPYRWFVKGNAVSMIPLACLEDKSIENLCDERGK